jgi:hypothetical protein
MERFIPASPFALVLLLLLSQVFLYAARVPVHRALRSLGRALGGAIRILSRWCNASAAEIAMRDREILLATGRAELETKIDGELRRIERSFSKELASYPQLHREMHELVAKMETDYRECGLTPPSPPGWSDAVAAVAVIPRDGDRGVQKILEEIHKSAVAGEKKALGEWRDGTAGRHKVLAKMAGMWKEAGRLLEATGKSVTRALESTRRIDAYMKSLEEVRKEEGSAFRALGWQQTRLFLVSLIVIGIAVAGAFVNFQLIALPMSELVPSGNRLLGVPVSTIAALVIVLMEIAAGVFLLDSLGITSLLPRLDLLAASKRRILVVVSFLALFFLAGVEGSLAVLREQIVEADSALKASLAGSPASHAATSSVPVIGQAVLGFILPWVLAMVAIPLEMLIGAVGHVGLSVASGALRFSSAGLRVLGWLVRGATDVTRWTFDVAIVVPLQIERFASGRIGPLLPARSPRPKTAGPQSESDHELASTRASIKLETTGGFR